MKYIPFECFICKRWPSRAFEGVSGVCQSCIQSHAKPPRFPVPANLNAYVAADSFDIPWSALIRQYKFAPEPGLARLWAGLMRRDDRIQNMLADADVLIPLPMSSERLTERGFNQAHALAKHLAKTKIRADWLIKTRDTRPLDREARQRNIANAFALNPGCIEASPGVANKRIVLIDDVMTTGASLAAAAQPLWRAGAAQVSAVVIAQTPSAAAVC